MSVVKKAADGEFFLHWDPQNVEIRSRAVEEMLQPLVFQVTTLVGASPSRNKKGRSRKGTTLYASIKKAIENFIDRGNEIATENPEMQNEFDVALDEVAKAGGDILTSASEFTNNPFDSDIRSTVVQCARNLLSAVTRLLILADMVDVHKLLQSLRMVSDDVKRVQSASSHQQLMSDFKNFGDSVVDVNQKASQRQKVLKDPFCRDNIAAARAVISRNAPMLLLASKTYIRHPEIAAAKANRDFCVNEITGAIEVISESAAGDPSFLASTDNFIAQYNADDGAGNLALALDEFDDNIVMDPKTYDEPLNRPVLEERLENIISSAALVADMSCTRPERRDRIVNECNAVRQALQDLLSQYEEACKSPKPLFLKRKESNQDEPTESLDIAVENMFKKTRDLRRQLRKAVVDHVSDSFFETMAPLAYLIETAEAGDDARLDEAAEMFHQHAQKLIEVAHLACSMSANKEAVRLVRIAAGYIDASFPQVINAARVLCARPNSQVAQENLRSFRETWERQVRLLTEAVDNIVTIDEFLAVTESHILEDVNKCVFALQENDTETLRRTATDISGRIRRVVEIVDTEMVDNYDANSEYVLQVMDAVNCLQEQILPIFTSHVNALSQEIDSGGGDAANIDENQFIETARDVYDGIRDVRRAVLMIRTPEEIESISDIEIDDGNYTQEAFYAQQESEAQMFTSTGGQQHDQSITGKGDENVDTFNPAGGTISSQRNSYLTAEEDLIEGIKNERALMRHLPAEEQAQIQQQVEYFREEKRKLDREVSKWDDSGNEIIVLSKQMCMIMMEMTDFTRGRGPLKTTMDVISAAKRISECGTELDKLARSIADQCPDSESKKDLLAYLQRIALYCHQLNITSKVKADVQSVSGELVVSGLDSATSLIQAAKNLMTAVVLTVKASYVASTKYTRHSTNKKPVVRWRMRLPEKKPLFRREMYETAVTTAAQSKGQQEREKNEESMVSHVTPAKNDSAKVARGPSMSKIEPAHELSAFTHDDPHFRKHVKSYRRTTSPQEI